MTRRSVFAVFASLFALVLSALMVVAPSQAETMPSFGPLDVSVPGHVTGSVTTDAAWVKLELLYAGTDVPPQPPLEVLVEPAAGSVEFDFPTWGLGSVKVVATACTTETACTNLAATSATVVPLKVLPTASVSDDLLGPDEPETVLTLSDPNGGGVLRVLWSSETYWPDPNGETVLPLATEGQRNLVVERCWSQEVTLCNARVRIPLTVNRAAHALAGSLPNVYADQDPGTIDTVVRFSDLDPLPEGTQATVEWELLDEDDRKPFGVDGTATVAVDAAGEIHVPMDFTGAYEYGFVLSGTISYYDPSVGAVLTGRLRHFQTFWVLHHLYVHVDRTYTVKARQFAEKWVAPCSRISKRTTRGFKRGLSLQSGVKCARRGWRNNGVELTYRFKLPSKRVEGYNVVELKGYGGAARAARGSWADMWMKRVSNTGQYGTHDLGPKVGWHRAGYALYVSRGRTLVWRVRVANGNRYELRDFKILVNVTVHGE